MSGKPEAGRMKIKNFEDKPLLRSLTARMRTAMETYLPGGAPAVPFEIFCAPPAMAALAREKHYLSIDVTGDKPLAAVLFCGSGFTDAADKDLEAAVLAGMSGVLRLLQANTRNRVAATPARMSEQDWNGLLHSARNYVFIKWRMGAGGGAGLVQALPDVFFMALCAMLFEPEMLEECRDSGLQDFIRMYENLEKSVGTDFPDGLAELDFRISNIFAGGQCAEIKWSMDFSDLFMLPAADVQLLLREARKRGAYESFISACAGSPATESAMARIVSKRGHEDFIHEVSRAQAAYGAGSNEEAGIEVMELALALYREGKLNPAGALKAKFDEAAAAHESPDLFDQRKALDDFAAVVAAMPARDIQLALARIPRAVMAKALRLDSHVGLMNAYKKIRENSSPKFRLELGEEITRTARGAAPESAKSAAACNARLRFVDSIRALAEEKVVSDAFRSGDRDWLGDNALGALMETQA